MQGFVEKIICALADADVDFLVVGGISAVLQGAPMVTQDLDICYQRSDRNLTRLAAALAPFQPRLRGLPPELPNVFDERTLRFGTNFTLEVEDESLALLAEMAAVGRYEDVIGRGDRVEVSGRGVQVLSLPDLIATKRAAARPKDLAAIPLLEETLKLREEEDRRTT